MATLAPASCSPRTAAPSADRLRHDPLPLALEPTAHDEQRGVHPGAPLDEIGRGLTRMLPPRLRDPRCLAQRGGDLACRHREPVGLRTEHALRVDQLGPTRHDPRRPGLCIDELLPRPRQLPLRLGPCLVAAAPALRHLVHPLLRGGELSPRTLLAALRLGLRLVVADELLRQRRQRLDDRPGAATHLIGTSQQLHDRLDAGGKRLVSAVQLLGVSQERGGTRVCHTPIIAERRPRGPRRPSRRTAAPGRRYSAPRNAIGGESMTWNGAARSRPGT